jgi:sec-independent protein translocase protein TatB
METFPGSERRMMFNVGPEKMAFVLLVALVVLGPEQLPDMARKIGNVVAELRRISAGLNQELHSVVRDITPVPGGADSSPSTSIPTPPPESPLDPPQSGLSPPAA